MSDLDSNEGSPGDYRRQLYDVYISAFKGSPSGAIAGSTFHRLMPHLHRVLRRLGDAVRVLDIGCGNGQLLSLLATDSRIASALGVDLSPEQIAIGKESGLDVEVADAVPYLSTRSDDFDLILAVDLLEHLRKDELLMLVEAVYRSLRPGGCFLVQTPNGQGLFSGSVVFGDLTHETVLNPSSLVQLYRYGGFDEIYIGELAPVGRARWAWLLIRLVAAWLKRIESGKHQDVWSQNMVGYAFRDRA